MRLQVVPDGDYVAMTRAQQTLPHLEKSHRVLKVTPRCHLSCIPPAHCLPAYAQSRAEELVLRHKQLSTSASEVADRVERTEIERDVAEKRAAG